MKFADINRRFTEITADYIAKGYTINAATMGGSEGEIGDIDFTDGTEIIRVVVQAFRDKTYAGEPCDLTGIEIVTGRATDKVKPHAHSTWATIWNSNLDVIDVQRFYEISNNPRSGEWYYGTLEETVSAYRIRMQRYHNRDNTFTSKEITEKAMSIAKRIVREKMGIKRVNEADIKVVKGKNAYIVYYRTKAYKLH